MSIKTFQTEKSDKRMKKIEQNTKNCGAIIKGITHM